MDFEDEWVAHEKKNEKKNKKQNKNKTKKKKKQKIEKNKKQRANLILEVGYVQKEEEVGRP